MTSDDPRLATHGLCLQDDISDHAVGLSLDTNLWYFDISHYRRRHFLVESMRCPQLTQLVDDHDVIRPVVAVCDTRYYCRWL